MYLNFIDGSFFISFGSGTAKREKPLALTPKKNLIFVKSKNLIFGDSNLFSIQLIIVVRINY